MHEVYALTLIAPKGTLLVPEALVSTPLAGIITESNWLNAPKNYESESTAADLLLSHKPDADMIAALRNMCDLQGIDYVLQPLDGREKKLLISDMDSTMIGQECIDEIARVIGKYDEVQAMTANAMHNVKNDFPTSLRNRLALLPGVTKAQLQHIFDHVITATPGAKTLVATMNARGASTHLVSGGFTFFSEQVANAIGFKTHDSNTLGFIEDKMTGSVEGAIIDGAAKSELLKKYAALHGLPLSATLAVGDGSNDIPMMKESGLGIAYHAKPAVENEAHARIRHNDLTALLYAQGISRDQWVEPEVVHGIGGIAR